MLLKPMLSRVEAPHARWTSVGAASTASAGRKMCMHRGSSSAHQTSVDAVPTKGEYAVVLRLAQSQRPPLDTVQFVGVEGRSSVQLAAHAASCPIALTQVENPVAAPACARKQLKKLCMHSTLHTVAATSAHEAQSSVSSTERPRMAASDVSERACLPLPPARCAEAESAWQVKLPPATLPYPSAGHAASAMALGPQGSSSQKLAEPR